VVLGQEQENAVRVEFEKVDQAAPPPAVATYTADWLRQHCNSPSSRKLRLIKEEEFAARHWGSDVFSAEEVNFTYSDVLDKAGRRGGLARLLGTLARYGIALVSGCPPSLEGARALSSSIGLPRRSLYGDGMWSTSSAPEDGEGAVGDSAYSNDALALHTDCAYLANPPGLQIFTCVQQAAVGGESMYLDGFAAASMLRKRHPESYRFFTRTVLRYACHDEGYSLLAEGPVFSERRGRLDQVRFNDYDRCALSYLSAGTQDSFYVHHRRWIETLRGEGLAVVHPMKEGETVILDNHRVLHGRMSFLGPRQLVGCYMDRDELASRMRICGLSHPALSSA
jgi:trimethyllysine dioxygenase